VRVPRPPHENSYPCPVQQDREQHDEARNGEKPVGTGNPGEYWQQHKQQ
jgi:hypothetical protein